MLEFQNKEPAKATHRYPSLSYCIFITACFNTLCKVYTLIQMSNYMEFPDGKCKLDWRTGQDK